MLCYLENVLYFNLLLNVVKIKLSVFILDKSCLKTLT